MGDRPLHKLEQSDVITPAGADWVRASLDPFHDYEITGLKGLPDLETEPSVIVRTQQSLSYSAPEGTTEPWDVNIFMSPVDFSEPTNSRYYTDIGTYYPRGDPTNAPGNFMYEKSTERRLDGLVLSAVESGRRTFNLDGAHAGLHLDDYLSSGSATDLVNYRVIGMGFEVVNTTAELYRQGAVTVYETGNGSNLTDVNHEDREQKEFRIGTSRAFRKPPTTLAEAKQTPGARTWAAAEGNYNVAKFRDLSPYTGVSKRDFVFAQNSMDDNDTSITSHKTGRQIASPGTAQPPHEVAGCSSHISEINTNGAYYTGLSPQTTLQITWRVILERLPAAFDLTMLALANPSAQYDPRAMELYSHVIREMAPGVPVSYNDAGKYFRMAEKVIREVSNRVSPIVKTAARAGVPGAGSVVAATRDVRAAAKLIKGVASKAKPRKRSVPNHGKP